MKTDNSFFYFTSLKDDEALTAVVCPQSPRGTVLKTRCTVDGPGPETHVSRPQRSSPESVTSGERLGEAPVTFPSSFRVRSRSCYVLFHSNLSLLPVNFSVGSSGSHQTL